VPVAPEWVGGSVLVWDFLLGNDWGMVLVPVSVVEWVAGLVQVSELVSADNLKGFDPD